MSEYYRDDRNKGSNTEGGIQGTYMPGYPGNRPSSSWWDFPSPDGDPFYWGDDKINQPYLRSLAGFLIVDKKDGMLLTGDLPCGIPPSIVVRGIDKFPRNEDGNPEDTLNNHSDCVIFKLDPIDPPDHDAESRLRNDGAGNGEPMKDVITSRWLSFCDPGSYTVSLKWQAGHHDYSICNQLAIDLWGISTGFRQFPLTAGSWTKAFSVTVTDDFSVIVNQRPGNVRANSKFFTEKKDDK